MPLIRERAAKADSGQNKAEATKHYTTKTEFVQGNLETLQKTIERKQDNVQSVVQVLQMKMQEQQQQA